MEHKNCVVRFNKDEISRDTLDKDALENDGKNIYKNHEFFRKLANLLEHPEYKSLFKEHFQSPDSIKLFITFVKLYEKIGDQFPDFNGYHKVSLMKSLINTSTTRQVICEEVHKYFDTHPTTVIYKPKNLFTKKIEN